VEVSGPLGAPLLLWEVAPAVAGRLLGINPFDQPDVESAKKAARELLDQGIGTSDEPAATDGAVEVRALGGDWLGGATTVPAALDALFGQLDAEHGYVAVMAYLDRLADAPLAQVRPALARATGRPTTFGWGPRFLHSTGQFHKGGPRSGRFLQLLHDGSADVEIPGAPYTFDTLKHAQAIGDLQTLRELGLPAAHVRLAGDDPASALRALTATIKEHT
jgi:glucose-6-phosphate isomerase